MSSPSDQPGRYGAAQPGPNPPTAYPPSAYPPDAYSPTAYPPNAYPADPVQPETPSAGAHRLETSEPRSLGELISQITTDLSTLVRQELELAKAEATQSAKRAGKGAGMFGGGGFAGYFVVLFLSFALWWALGDGIGYGWSALVVAVLWAIVAAILVVLGRKQFAAVRGLNRTSETLGKIPNAAKGNEQENR